MKTPEKSASSKSQAVINSVKPDLKFQRNKKVKCSHCKSRCGPAAQFQCRCGRTFCTIHRYPELHQCTFDFREEGRRIIAKANPRIVSEKIQKI